MLCFFCHMQMTIKCCALLTRAILRISAISTFMEFVNMDWALVTMFSCGFCALFFPSSGFAEAKHQQMIFCSTFGRPRRSYACIVLFWNGIHPVYHSNKNWLRTCSLPQFFLAFGELPFEIMYVQPLRGFKTGVLPSLLFKFPIMPFDFSGAGINLTLLCLSRCSVWLFQKPPPLLPTIPRSPASSDRSWN